MLKEKFQNIDDEGKTWNQIYDLQEQIADDYAIEFAEWMALSCTQMQKILSQKAKYFHLIKRDYFTAKELLEIFKKEKGL